MGKYIDPALLDLCLDDIKAKGNKLTVCEGQPIDYADVAARALGEVVIASGDYVGPADGVSGRKLTVNGQSGLAVATGGLADHLAITDTVNSRLLYVTTIATPQTVLPTNTMDLGAWDINLQDPV